MPRKRVDQVVGVLNVQREKVCRLYEDYSSAYDAVFEQHSAMASIKRWCDRTIKIIQEELGHTEAVKFREALSGVPRGRGSWHWRELCEYFDTYLMRLVEDIEENPDSLSDHDSSPNAASEFAATASPIGQQDVFLSYSAQDKDEARELYDALTQVGKKCFLAEKSLRPGDRFDDEIRDAIDAAKEVWILASPNSMQSAWVQRETSAAWALKKRIIPIMLHCGPSDLPEIIATTHAIDFHKMLSEIEHLR